MVKTGARYVSRTKTRIKTSIPLPDIINYNSVKIQQARLVKPCQLYLHENLKNCWNTRLLDYLFWSCLEKTTIFWQLTNVQLLVMWLVWIIDFFLFIYFLRIYDWDLSSFEILWLSWDTGVSLLRLRWESLLFLRSVDTSQVVMDARLNSSMSTSYQSSQLINKHRINRKS